MERENTGLNHNILQWWMMILIQPEWESATPNQPADRCRTDWFMPRVAYISQLSAGNGSYAEVTSKSLQTTKCWPGGCVRCEVIDISVMIVCVLTASQDGPCWCWCGRASVPACCLVLLGSCNYQVQCIGWCSQCSHRVLYT